MVVASNGTEDGRESSQHSDCSMLTEVAQGGAPFDTGGLSTEHPFAGSQGTELLAVMSSLTTMHTNEVVSSILTIHSKVLDKEAIKASTNGRECGDRQHGVIHGGVFLGASSVRVRWLLLISSGGHHTSPHTLICSDGTGVDCRPMGEICRQSHEQ